MGIKTMWSFRVTAHDETDIHGGFYRVEIMRFAENRSPRVRGSVRNIRYEPEIEVKLIATDVTEATKFRDELDTYLNKDRKDDNKLAFKEVLSFQGEEDNFKEFKVIREDELTEMVWALQGAGQIFRRSTQDIVKAIIIRDLKRERSLLYALKMEVKLIGIRADTMIKSLERGDRIIFQFECHCIQKTLTDPPIPDDNSGNKEFDNDKFMMLTHELFTIVNRYEKTNFDGLQPVDKIKELENLKKLTSDESEYDVMINSRMNDLDKVMGLDPKGNKPVQGDTKS